MNGRPGVTERLARVCSAHPWRTLAAWGAIVVAALALVATSLGGLTSDATVSGNPESAQAASLLLKAFPPTPAELKREVSDVIVVSSGRYTARTPAFRRFVAGLEARLRATHELESIRTGPVPPGGHAQLIRLLIPNDDAAAPVEDVVGGANGGAFQVAVTGDHTVGNDFGEQSQRDLEHGELLIGLPAALIILLLVFGAVVGALVPVFMAIISILVGLGFVALLSTQFDLSVFIVNMLTGMGLALGIDYSLFVVSRYREERFVGAPEDRAIAIAGATASRAVLFSGSTFVIALFGMLLVPTTIMRSLAAGAIIVGVVSVAAALTLLPAVLGLLRDRVNAGRVPFVGRNLGRADAAEGRFWRAIVERVLRRPVLSLTISVAALLAAAVPLLGLKIGASGVSSLPDSLPSKQGYIALQKWFPQSNPYPALLVVQGGDGRTLPALERLRREIAGDPRFGPATIRSSPRTDLAVLQVPVRGDANARSAVSAVRELRTELRSELAGTDATVDLGGHTAEQGEYYDAVTNPTPYVFAFVLGLSFILLTIAFRSVMIALVSIVLHLPS